MKNITRLFIFLFISVSFITCNDGDPSFDQKLYQGTTTYPDGKKFHTSMMFQGKEYIINIVVPAGNIDEDHPRGYLTRIKGNFTYSSKGDKKAFISLINANKEYKAYVYYGEIGNITEEGSVTNLSDRFPVEYEVNFNKKNSKIFNLESDTGIRIEVEYND